MKDRDGAVLRRCIPALQLAGTDALLKPQVKEVTTPRILTTECVQEERHHGRMIDNLGDVRTQEHLSPEKRGVEVTEPEKLLPGCALQIAIVAPGVSDIRDDWHTHLRQQFLHVFLCVELLSD